jgi:hypothetical protein
MGKAAIARPALDLWTAATLTASNEDADYPIENSQDYNPANPFKATGVSTTIDATHTSAAREAIAFINTSLLVGTSTFTAGGVAVTPAARTADGQCVNCWKRLDLGASTTTQIVITTAPATVQIGRIVLVSDVTELNWIWGAGGQVGEDYEWPTTKIVTFGGTKHVYDKGYRIRTARGTVKRETDRQTLLTLAQSAKGENVPFLFIPDVDVNDAWYVRLSSSTLAALKKMRNVTDVSIDFVEESSGLPL